MKFDWKYLLWGGIAIISQLVPQIPAHVSNHIDTICEIFGIGQLFSNWFNAKK